MNSFRFEDCLTSEILFISSGDDKAIVQAGPLCKVVGSVVITELVGMGITEAVSELSIGQPVGYDISTFV